jgi:dsRNA-specific ribonuclease
MKRLRLERWAGQLLTARSGAPSAPSCQLLQLSRVSRIPRQQVLVHSLRRHQSTTTIPPSGDNAFLEGEEIPLTEADADPLSSSSSHPSPSPERALTSAKLAALHARLSLPDKLPLQTLARALVDPSADSSPNFNNANLAFLGSSLINYHTSEWLICKYPRLPMAILFEAMRSYAGPATLYRVAQQWGVESAAAPGEEVDPGLLQWSDDPAAGVLHTKWGYVRKEAAYLDKYKWRRGLSSRVVMDDEFGDVVHAQKKDQAPALTPADEQALQRAEYEGLRNNANAAFVRAIVGAISIHAGRDAAKAFVNAHILSRTVNLSQLFHFQLPTRELAMLCAREGFESPVARILSETGRRSRTPVFVVGIFSGHDKLGEGAGPSLDVARIKAAMNALKAWYLYSPGNKVRVPSDMLEEGAKPWQPAHIDMGEII